MLAPVGAPGAQGDGLRLAMGAGAALGCMSEAWWCPAISIPGETIDGAPMFRLILTERARAGSLIVDSTGRRFVNEAQNYNDLGRALQDFDPARFAFRHVPAWLIFDGTYRETYRLGPLSRRDPDPEWLATAPDLAGLAQADRRRARDARGDGRALQRGRRTRGGPGLRPRLVSLRPLHRRGRPARARPVLRAARAARLPEHEGRPAHRRRRPRAARSRTARRSPASTPPATPRRARSGSPTPAPAGRSARRWCSGSGRVTRRRRTDADAARNWSTRPRAAGRS